METGQLTTTALVAAFASAVFQYALKPLLQSWLVKGDDVSPAYGLVCILVLAPLAILGAALGATLGLTFAADKFVDLAIGGWVLSVFGYESIRNGKSATIAAGKAVLGLFNL